MCMYIYIHGFMVTCYVIISIRVHISLKVCFQLQYVATVHTIQMERKHMNMNTYIWFKSYF